jgi:hypothetical protein
MLESIIMSVGLVPQSWCVSFPDRIAMDLSEILDWQVLNRAFSDAADWLQV